MARPTALALVLGCLLTLCLALPAPGRAAAGTGPSPTATAPVRPTLKACLRKRARAARKRCLAQRRRVVARRPSRPRPPATGAIFGGAGSPWTTPFAALGRPVPLRPDSRVLVEDLVRQTRFGVGIEQQRWTTPLYVVRSTDPYPRRRIHLGHVGRWKADPRTGTGDAGAVLAWQLYQGIDGRGWPIPDWAQGDPSGVSDAHLTLYVQDTGQYVELNSARRLPDGDWVAGWGGYVHDARAWAGLYTDDRSRSEAWSSQGWGSLASSLGVAGGLIREAEIRAAYAAYRRGDHERAVIPHALGLNVHAHTRNTWVWPAGRTDGTTVYGEGGDPIEAGPIEMGQIFRLPADLDVRALRHGSARDTALLQIVARTIQRYGAIVWDQTGGGFKLRAEQVWSPQGGYGDMFDFGRSDEWLAALPLHRFQAVETRAGLPGHYRPAR